MKCALVLLAALAVVQCSVFQNPHKVITPRHESDKDWYESAIFYQIYPRSFKDSDGDGVGDIQGIISELQHLKDAGVQATWLSPIFASPMKDFGYDVSDFRAVDPIFGTNEDLEELFRRANELDIKIILDFVPNHSSDQHEWFIKSVNREAPYTDYYVWKDCGTPPNLELPNNWNSVFYGSAWTYNEQRGQCYLHQFVPEQPDLDYRNPLVVQEMKDVLSYWLERGAAGFRIDAINHLFEHIDFLDEPRNLDVDDPLAYGYTHKIYSKDQEETYEMVYDWRQLIDEFNANLIATNNPNPYTRILMTEAYASRQDTMRYYGSATRTGAHMPFNFVLINELNEGSSATDFKNVIDDLLAALPEGKTTNWVIGNHDQPRVGSRYGVRKIDGLLALVMTLPGIAVTYNGEEIGMVDYRDITFEDTLDPQGCNLGEDGYKWASRDPVRTPFQWDDTENAGFTSAGVKTWLPVHPNYQVLNLKLQKELPRSVYKFYLELSELRKDHTMIDGTYESRVLNNDVLTYIRAMDGHDWYVTVINFADSQKTVNLKTLNDNIGDHVKVVAAGSMSHHSNGEILQAGELHLEAHDTLILTNKSTALTVSAIVLILATLWHLLF